MSAAILASIDVDHHGEDPQGKARSFAFPIGHAQSKERGMELRT
jgi:hypothetical protein